MLKDTIQTSFLKGFGEFTINLDKLSFVNTSSNYKYIDIIFDLLQKHPELFKSTANNLLYILNLGTNYKQDVLYDMFKEFIYVKPSISTNLTHQSQVTSNLTDKSNSKNLITTTAYPILVSYYLYQNKVLNSYEPTLETLSKVLEEFKLNPIVYCNKKQFKLDELKPICFTTSGFNFNEFMLYYAYYITYLIYGKPYTFYDEIGSNSALGPMLNSLDTYISSCLKLLAKSFGSGLSTKSTQLVVNDYNIYNTFKSNNQLEKLQETLDSMLSFDSIIKIQQTELNKTDELLTECYQSQVTLSYDYLKSKFNDVIDNLVKITVENCIFNQIYDHIPIFTSTDIIFSTGSNRVINIENLNEVLEYVLSGSSGIIKIDSDYHFRPVQLDDTKSNSIETDLIRFNRTKIKRYKNCFNVPYITSNVILKALTAYIKQQINNIQDSFIDSNVHNTTDINIDDSIFTQQLYQQVSKFLLNGLNFDNKSFIDSFLKYYSQTEDYKQLALVSTVYSKIYEQDVRAYTLNIYLMSHIKQMLYSVITNETRSINLIDYITSVDIDVTKLEFIYDTLISFGICQLDDFSDFVNKCIGEFDKLISSQNIYNVYVSGNVDLSSIYSIGGIELYNQMLDVNPFNRGYAFVSSVYGTTELIDYVTLKLSSFKDSSLIKLLENSDSTETITNIVKMYNQELVYKPNTILISLLDYTITDITDDTITIKKHNIPFYNLNINGIGIVEYLLKYSFNQIRGNYCNETFRCKRLMLKNNKVNASLPETVNSIGDNTVNIVDVGEFIDLPVLKYLGEWSNVQIKTNLKINYKLDLTTCGKRNMCLILA